MLLDLERGLIVELPQLMQLQHNKDMFYLVYTSSSKPTLWKVHVYSVKDVLSTVHTHEAREQPGD